MFEILSADKKFDFVSKFKITTVVSAMVVIVSMVFAITKMNYGVDFRGGAEIQLKFKETVTTKELRDSLKSHGWRASVQTIGEATENEFLLKVQAGENELNQVSQDITVALRKEFADKADPNSDIVRKVDIVGPKAGAQLRISGFQAMLWALIAIMIYIGLRFDFKYSPGAIVALFHDVTIILGIFALAQVEFTLQTVAALLAVIGYSVNDTVVVYDRVREHEEKYAGLTLADHINNAVNETLSRTLLTSGTTLFISLSMYLFGGGAIKDFFLAISLGVLIGTYSSIFIAAPVTLFFARLQGKKEKKAVA